jgi:hypothetical protein
MDNFSSNDKRVSKNDLLQQATRRTLEGSASSNEVVQAVATEGERQKHGRFNSFRGCDCLKDGQTVSNILDERKLQMDTAVASASAISWACTNPARIQP